MQSQIDRKIDQTDTIILFILGSLTFCIAFGLSSPALLVNDEWITVNQVNQLASGSQLIESEGKYGSTFEGEVGAYFNAKMGYLAYTLFLPILSLPALYGIMITGDLFRLVLLVLWFVLGMCALFASLWLLDSLHHKRGVYLLWAIIILFFTLFLANIYYYQPYAASFIDSPIESAAVILTNEILFAMMTPMIYAVFRNVSLPRKTALIGAISVICCSSYPIWSSSAKDHLLVAFLLIIIFLLLSSIIYKDSGIKWFLMFFIVGFLCWVRTEYGAVILVGLIIWFLVIILTNYKQKIINYVKIIKFQLFPALLGMAIGLMPLLINNYMVTGNPLIPPQYLYLSAGRRAWTSVLETSNSTSTGLLQTIITYIQQIIDFFSPDINNAMVDIPRLLFSPENNGVGVLFICPIILPALLYIIVCYSESKYRYSKDIRTMLLFSGFIATITILAYLRVLYGSTISSGSMPDMRYFSPVYLPLGIISILLLSPIINSNSDRWLRYILTSVCLGAPLLVVFTIIFLLNGITFYSYVNLHTRLLLIILLVFFGVAAWTKKIWKSPRIFPIFFSLLLLLPSAFQFFFIVVNALAKINGYLYWQPVLQYYFTYVLLIMG